MKITVKEAARVLERSEQFVRIGLYAGMGMTGERVQADDVQVVTVETNQTVWDVARPIADAEGLDIREVVYQIQVNNNLDKDCTVIPGQQLVIRF
ncbi:LysM domain-containing protein [Megasphaera sp.]|uniref:LysM domain-containing protein n=1 Tax=Megasphaera sp. TaxID=2023260 RepID=UPI00257F78B2|nr:LysM domain-containing protein [Megasphaera sp.]